MTQVPFANLGYPVALTTVTTVCTFQQSHQSFVSEQIVRNRSLYFHGLLRKERRKLNLWEIYKIACYNQKRWPSCYDTTHGVNPSKLTVRSYFLLLRFTTFIVWTYKITCSPVAERDQRAKKSRSFVSLA